MEMNLREDKFHIRAYFASCSCRCEFCCLGNYPKEKRITFDEYEKVMLKFQNIEQLYGMRLRSFIYNCAEHPFVKRQVELYDRLPMAADEYTQLDLNGTKKKSEQEICDWFESLTDAGIKKVAFSWFGNNDTHDKFVNCPGYYKYLVACANEARKRSLPVVSKVFLHKGILSELDKLLGELMTISDRIILAFMEYTGNAKGMLDQFVTEDDLIEHPEILPYMSDVYLKKFRPEREWIHLANSGTFPKFNIVDYILYLDSDNIEYVLTKSVDDIINDFRVMNREFMESIPSITALADKYGDSTSNVFFECRDVMRKWLDSFYEDACLDKERLFSFTKNSVEWKVYERL